MVTSFGRLNSRPMREHQEHHAEFREMRVSSSIRQPSPAHADRSRCRPADSRAAAAVRSSRHTTTTSTAAASRIRDELEGVVHGGRTPGGRAGSMLNSSTAFSHGNARHSCSDVRRTTPRPCRRRSLGHPFRAIRPSRSRGTCWPSKRKRVSRPDRAGWTSSFVDALRDPARLPRPRRRQRHRQIRPHRAQDRLHPGQHRHAGVLRASGARPATATWA